MNAAMTYEAVLKAKEEMTVREIDEIVASVNRHLSIHDPFPGGHWDVAKKVPIHRREAVAARFRAAGWQVSFTLDLDSYADYFNISPPKAPYR